MAVEYVDKGQPDGTSFGQSTTDKISFYGVTPITQRTNANQAQIVITGTIIAVSSGFGFATSALGNQVLNMLNEFQAALVALGLIKGS